ncbi:MAG: hypothetical protein Q7S44_01690 [bacterium]|nr:hypothetical protein [bacterium]
MQKGFASLAVLLILLVGISVGVYLVQNKQTFFSKAKEPQKKLTLNTSPKWGHIADLNLQNQPVRGIFFFAGPPNPNSKQFYTRIPIDAEKFEWRNDNDINFIFDQIKSAGINVIKLSWWGHNDEYNKWAPTLSSVEVNNKVFVEAEKRGLLVAPVIEVSPAFEFFREYPDNTSNLEIRIKDVLSTYGNHQNWLKLYDKNGKARKVIWLIETIHLGPVDTTKFAQTFDLVAEKIKRETKQEIGFVIDPTPLPPNGSYDGPDPNKLKNTKSLVAINPFNITSDGQTEDERLTKSKSILSKWKNSGLPLITPILPGYDDSKIRPENYQKYGDNPIWRNQVLAIARYYQTAGITLDIWNGFTEGYTFVPTVETGYENYNLAKSSFGISIVPTPIPSSTPTPTAATEMNCTQDNQCPNDYKCQVQQGETTVCPSFVNSGTSATNINDSCTPTTTIIKGQCKLAEGKSCQSNSDCYTGLVCHRNLCTNPISGVICSGTNDTTCPNGYKCVQGCSGPVTREGEKPAGYFCQIEELANQPRNCPI